MIKIKKLTENNIRKFRIFIKGIKLHRDNDSGDENGVGFYLYVQNRCQMQPVRN